MRQLTTMFVPTQPTPVQARTDDIPSATIKDHTNSSNINEYAHITTTQHWFKKQDTWPTPTKRKLTQPKRTTDNNASNSDDEQSSNMSTTAMMDMAPTTQEQYDDV